jgi:hypothetical protein
MFRHVDGGGVDCLNLPLANDRQRRRRDARVANSQHTAGDKVSKSRTAHPQEFPQTALRPPILDSCAHAERSEPEAHGTDGTAKTLGDLRDWFVAGPIQKRFFRNDRQRGSGGLSWSLRARPFPKSKHMRATFWNEYPRTRVRRQFFEGSQQCIHHEIHPQVFG